MNIGQDIHLHRERLGISQRRLAKQGGVSHSYVAHIESGRRMPSIKVLVRLAKALGLRVALVPRGAILGSVGKVLLPRGKTLADCVGCRRDGNCSYQGLGREHECQEGVP